MNSDKYYIRPLSDEELLSVYTKTAPLHFPAGELRPLSNIRNLLSRGGYEGLGIFAPSRDSAEGSLLGYALFLRVPGEDTILLDYYAILEEYRSLGLGSFFLSEMKRHYHNLAGILLETEDLAFAQTKEERKERTRRNTFYFKNGAHPTGVFCTLFGVPFQILFLPFGESSPADRELFQKKLDKIYRFMLPEELYRQGVQWR